MLRRVVRLNSDGSIDPSFISPFGGNVFQANTATEVEAIQPDGKILVSVVNVSAGVVGYSLYRLNANGTFDTAFTTIDFQSGRIQYDSIDKVFALPDGKILVSGVFVGASTTEFLRRYNSDGTRDTTFESPVLTGDRIFSNVSTLNDFDVQSDGSIVIVGRFVKVNGVDRVNIARLLPSGNVDSSFVPANVIAVGEIVNRVKILSNGKILVSAGAVTIVGSPAGGQPFCSF
ncbi:MAG: delta-60 repeat domain-containing protein [Pyrinomonadaceae bacterium]